MSIYEQQGWTCSTVADLQNDYCTEVPQVSGVYVVRQPDMAAPMFLERSVGGFFQQRDPTLPVHLLQGRWVNDSDVLYIGRATWDLRKRLREYMDFGEGRTAPHYEGRAVWQLQNHQSLIVCWKAQEKDPDAGTFEKMLLDRHQQRYGKPPFANIHD